MDKINTFISFTIPTYMESEANQMLLKFCLLLMHINSGVARNQHKGGGHGAREGRPFPTRGAPLMSIWPSVGPYGRLHVKEGRI